MGAVMDYALLVASIKFPNALLVSTMTVARHCSIMKQDTYTILGVLMIAWTFHVRVKESFFGSCWASEFL